MRSRARYDQFLAALVQRYLIWVGEADDRYLRLCYPNIARALKAIAVAAKREGDDGVAVGAARLATVYGQAGPLRPLLH